MAIWHRRNRAQNIGARLDALKADFAALKKDMRGLADEAGEAASDVLETTDRAAEDALDTVEEWTNDNIGSLRDQVRRQPLAAVILSMSAGAVVGAILLRR